MNLYFKEPRLNLSTPGEFLVRIVTYSFYIVLAAVTVVLLLGEISSLRALAALFALFLIDRLIHLGGAEKYLSELKGQNINLAEALTPGAYRLLSYSFRKTLVTGQDFHFILIRELLDRRDIRQTLKRLDVLPDKFSEKIDEVLVKKSDKKFERPGLLKIVEELVRVAYDHARETGEKFIEPRNLFVALAVSGELEIMRLFEAFDLKAVDLQEAVVLGRYVRTLSGIRRLPAVLGGFGHQPRFLRHRIMNRAWTARPTPTLDSFSTDLTDLARAEKVGFLIGHQKELDQLIDIISRPGKPNALLVGEAGSGRSAIVAHLAYQMIKDDVPPALFDKRLVSLEIADLVADAPPEVLSGRLQKIVEEIILAGNIVLFIPNTHDLFRTSQVRALNAIDLILPVIKSEAIPVVGETYPREFKQLIQPRSDFLDQFEVVNVDEVSESEALRFLIFNSLILEKEYKVFVTFRAISKAVALAHRYFRNKLLPGSAVDLLKQALVRAKHDGLKTLSADQVIEVAEEQSKIPIQRAGGEETEKLLNLETLIHKKLINQDAAVKAVSRALREYRSGLSRKGGPIATFLFVGPTGVGKTELAKTLTQIQFGSKELMLRFDMSEYQDKQSIFRFIGTPDGEKTGALTDAVLESPYSLVLLDEFEKAHSDILNLFLQVFDDGRLTDSLGRTVDFQNTIIIATSNAHSEFIKTEIEKGRSSEEVGEDLKKKLIDYFKPELLNRFSATIAFRSLNQKEIFEVTKLLVKEVADTLSESQGISLTINETAIQKISELGYSPVFGARPLRQVISDKLRSVLAEKILRKEIVRGNKIELAFINNDFEFKIIS